MPDWDFHFLRPLWLLFIPYALWLHTRLRRAYSASLQWQGAIAPQLLEQFHTTGLQHAVGELQARVGRSHRFASFRVSST